MSAKRNQAIVMGASSNEKDHAPEEGGEDHIDKKFKHDTGAGEDGEDDDEDDDEAPKSGKRAGRRKIKIEYIEDKSRRHITFSKRKSGIMKKAYELSTLTGTQVLLLVVSETGLVYTFTTPKLQPLVTKAEGKNLIQACLHAPDKESTPDRYNAPDQEASPAAASDQDHEEQSSSPTQSSHPPPPQQNMQQNPPYSGSSASMGMYPPPYSHIPFPNQGSPAPYNYPNMGMGYQSPNPNGSQQPPSQYWAPTPQQQQMQGDKKK
ncbi:transcription factor of the MADS box [Entomortierella chlamydospora]|uniref:Transcription factor of the MADS box n=1 Tax=Entomortierella chlamydospora TaxID=101097 RepID=A0A9P6MGQ8_9FUNG|nr:transcription factor of the MADS box [Entomortierella chlamydospora]KAF9998465.1 transcription factor of the MADS box [Entomortierella chlamydospora]